MFYLRSIPSDKPHLGVVYPPFASGDIHSQMSRRKAHVPGLALGTRSQRTTQSQKGN